MKTSKRKAKCICIFSLIALGLVVSCAKKKPLPQQKNTEQSNEDSIWDGSHYIPEEGAQLKIWWDNEEMLEAIIEEWTAAYPNIPLEYEKVSTIETRRKMTLDGPAGLGADVFIQTHDGILSSHQDGILLPMGRYQEVIEKDFNQQAVKVANISGQQYAIPWSLENIALFYNKDLYGEQPPRTWEEIIEFAQSYNDPATNKWAVRWEVNNAYMSYFFLTAYGFRVFGPSSTDPENPGWDSPEVIEALKFFQSLRSIFDVSADDASGEYTVNEFTKGTVPLTVSGPWSIQNYKEAGLNFGVAKLPMLPGNRQPYVFSGVQIINVSSYTKYPNAARRLAMFLTSDKVLSHLYKITGKLPAKNNSNQIEGITEDPYLKGVLEQAPYSYPMPTIPEIAFMWDPQRILFYYTWNGELSPEEVVKKATEDYFVALNTSREEQ